MSDEEVRMAEECWSWVRAADSPLALGAGLAFVHGVSTESVPGMLRMEIGRAQMLPLSGVREALPFPESDEHGNPIAPWIRVGRTKDWSFVVESAALLVEPENRISVLSAGTQAIEVCWTAKPTYVFRFYSDGEDVTTFEPGMAWYRTGSDPDRFLAEIRGVGLRTERPAPAEPGMRRNTRERRRVQGGHGRDKVIQLLAIVTLATGIRISAEVAHGPLLTCQRRPE